MPLDGLHQRFAFGKIRFINDGFITKKRILALKNLEKCFWPLTQKLGIGSKNSCLWRKLYWRPLSACKVWWRSINLRRQENENKSFLFVFVTLTTVGATQRRTAFVDVGVSSLFITRSSCSFLRFLEHDIAFLTTCINLKFIDGWRHNFGGNLQKFRKFLKILRKSLC